MVKIINYLKLFIYFLLSKASIKYLGIYLWPNRLLNRRFSYDEYYSTGLFVNLGGGPYFNRNGWINVDLFENYYLQKNWLEYNLYSNLDKLPFKNANCIYLSHTLEHFKIGDAKRLLVAIKNSLTEGGTLRIIIPDADLIINKCRNNDIEYFKPYFPFFKKFKLTSITNIDILYFFLCQPRCSIYNNKLSCQNDLINILRLDNSSILNLLNNHSFDNNKHGSLHLSSYNYSLIENLLNDIGFSFVYRSAFMQSNFAPMREAPIFDGTHPWLSLYVEAIK